MCGSFEMKVVIDVQPITRGRQSSILVFLLDNSCQGLTVPTDVGAMPLPLPRVLCLKETGASRVDFVGPCC